MKSYTVELPPEFDNVLRTFAMRNHISLAEALTRAIGLLAIANDERQKNDGSTLGVVRKIDNKQLEAVALIEGM